MLVLALGHLLPMMRMVMLVRVIARVLVVVPVRALRTGAKGCCHLPKFLTTPGRGHVRALFGTFTTGGRLQFYLQLEGRGHGERKLGLFFASCAKPVSVIWFLDIAKTPVARGKL